MSSDMAANTPSFDKNATEDDLADSLLMELECPVCTEYMIPPITLCENGHNICSKCRPKMKECPNCRRTLLLARNLALEKLINKIKYPCCNRKTGCEESFHLDQIVRHQGNCLHGLYDCPLAQAPGILCFWQGPRSEVRKHVDMNHKHRVTEAVSRLSVYTRVFDSAYKYCRVIYALGEVFYQQFDIKGEIFYFVVQHVGPNITDSKYKYEFTLESSDGDEKIQVSHYVLSVKMNIDDIRKSGKCVKLHSDVVKNFMEDDSLKFEMEISEIRGTPYQEDSAEEC
jgi:E3 ubiquitin-protein ligase SIAH1